jgi:hypothetical protein
VCPVLEYGASCWGINREGQINALDHVQKRVAKLANHMNDLVWETLAQRRKIARICALFKAYTAEEAWKSIGDRLKGPHYLSRNDHDRKIRARKQRTDIGYW